MQAVREAAARSAKRKGRKGCPGSRYIISELCGLTTLPQAVVRRELRVLKKASLLVFSEPCIAVDSDLHGDRAGLCESLAGRRSERRPIPVSRAVLRFVARTDRRAISQVMLAYVIRGAVLDRKTMEVKGAGTVKASWIAKTFKLSLRSAKSGRAELIKLGFVSKDTGSFQRKLNRDGAYFKMCFDWLGGNKFAPRPAKSRALFAPPYKDMKTSYESKNQKPQSSALKPSGVCKANEDRKPSLRAITVEDLRDYQCLEELYEQACRAGWVKPSESCFLNWIAAAVRANSVKARDPVRVFVVLVRQGKWGFITQAQEDRARAIILKHRSEMFHEIESPKRSVGFTSRKLKYCRAFPQNFRMCSTAINRPERAA